MFINRLSLKQFRNYQDASIEFKKNINIIIGNNAQGKTSLIESIYVLSTTKSHRTSKDSQLILFNEDFARIEADITRAVDELHLSLIMPAIFLLFTVVESKVYHKDRQRQDLYSE